MGCPRSRPLDPGDADERVRWWNAEVGITFTEDDAADLAAFWDRLAVPGVELVAWMSSRCVQEYCGFLELVWRAPHAMLSVIDAAPVASAFALLSDKRIIDSKLLESVTALTESRRAIYRAEWQPLRTSDSTLRILTPTGLRSAPLSHYDSTLLSFVTNEWQRCAGVVAHALVACSSGDFYQFSFDPFLFDRLLRLIDDGTIEGERDEELWSMRTSRVRRRR